MEPQSHSVSVVIIARNEERTVRRCVESALGQTCGVREVIVVDGNSADRTAEIAAEMARGDERVRLVSEDAEPPHRGPAAARNLGASLASGDLLLFLNADVHVAPDYVEQMLPQLDVDELAAVAGLRWNERGPLVAGLMNVHYALSYNASPAALSQPTFLSGDAMLIRRSAFEAVGGYDVTMPAGEDADLGHRLREARFRIAYRRDATIWHDGGHYRSWRGWLRQMAWYGRGAAALARAYPERRRRAVSGLLKHVLLPAAAAASWVALAAASVITGSLFLWTATAVAGIAVAARYLHSFLRARRACHGARLPSPVSLAHLLAYPLFRTARYGLLSTFTWADLLRSRERREPEQLGDAGF